MTGGSAASPSPKAFFFFFLSLPESVAGEGIGKVGGNGEAGKLGGNGWFTTGLANGGGGIKFDINGDAGGKAAGAGPSTDGESGGGNLDAPFCNFAFFRSSLTLD